MPLDDLASEHAVKDNDMEKARMAAHCVGIICGGSTSSGIPNDGALESQDTNPTRQGLSRLLSTMLGNAWFTVFRSRLYNLT